MQRELRGGRQLDTVKKWRQSEEMQSMVAVTQLSRRYG